MMHDLPSPASPEFVDAWLAEAVNEQRWQPAKTAPKDGTCFLAWCPVEPGLGDGDATPDADMRIVWWETRGQFTSDRDLGSEVFTHWHQLPAPPGEAIGKLGESR